MVIDRNIDNLPMWLYNVAFKKGNHLTDSLAKLAAITHQCLICQAYQQLPTYAKGPFLLDKWEMPIIRTKYDKSNFSVSWSLYSWFWFKKVDIVLYLILISRWWNHHCCIFMRSGLSTPQCTILVIQHNPDYCLGNFNKKIIGSIKIIESNLNNKIEKKSRILSEHFRQQPNTI